MGCLLAFIKNVPRAKAYILNCTRQIGFVDKTACFIKSPWNQNGQLYF